jgi:hypothetical protein
MEHTTHTSRLRYLDADDLDDSIGRFNDLEVYGNDGAQLGELDGFLVEHGAGTVHYLVVDSGGWFTSRRFLLPAEHVTVDREANAVRANVSKASLQGYPDFDEDRFGRFSDDEYHAYRRRLGSAWPSREGATTSASDANTMYRQPDWWRSNAFRADRLRPIESRAFVSRSGFGTAAAGATAAGAAAYATRDDDRHSHGDVTHTHPGGHEHHTHDTRELVTAHDRDDERHDHDSRHDAGERDRDDVSPHFGGRAQPGDILGLETGGETTGLGDSAEEENKRRRTAEKSRGDLEE